MSLFKKKSIIPIIIGVIIVLFAMLIIGYRILDRALLGEKVLQNDLDHPVSVMTLSTDPFHDNPARDPAVISKQLRLAPGDNITVKGSVECVSIDGQAYNLPSGSKNTFRVSQISTEGECAYSVEWLSESRWTCSGGKQSKCVKDIRQN